MEHYNINTTQNVQIEFRIASVGDRILAYLLDGLFIGILVAALYLIIGIRNTNSPIFYLVLLPFIFYHLLCETFLNGQSFGKMILKIKVVKYNGSELSFGSCFIRWIFRFIDLNLFSGIVAIISIIINGKGQRLGDMAAGTTVLKTDTKEELHNPLFQNTPEDHIISFPEVAQLNDSDIQTINEVLILYKDELGNHPQKQRSEIIHKTKAALEKKMGTSSEQTPLEFLNIIIKDYYAFHK